jgi:hypothetical protein
MHVEVRRQPTSCAAAVARARHRCDDVAAVVDDDDPKAGECQDASEDGDVQRSTCLDSRDERLSDAQSFGEFSLAEVGEPSRSAHVPGYVERDGRAAWGCVRCHRTSVQARSDIACARSPSRSVRRLAVMRDSSRCRHA